MKEICILIGIFIIGIIIGILVVNSIKILLSKDDKWKWD